MWKYVWVKKCVKIREMLFKNWKWLFKITNQTPPIFLFYFFFMSWYEYPCYSKLKNLSLSNENWKQIVWNYELGQTCGIHSPKYLIHVILEKERGTSQKHLRVCKCMYYDLFLTHIHHHDSETISLKIWLKKRNSLKI